MIVKYFEERIDASVKQVEFSLTCTTRLVKFGPFGFYNNKLTNFIEPWMGEYDEQLKSFKFFRTIRDTDRTSEFYVKGKLLEQLNSTIIRYGVGVHYSPLFGLLGIVICLYAFNFLLVTRQYIQVEWYWIPVAFLGGVVYGYSQLKDYRKTVKEFQELIHGDVQQLQSRVQYRDDDYE